MNDLDPQLNKLFFFANKALKPFPPYSISEFFTETEKDMSLFSYGTFNCLKKSIKFG